MLQTGVLYSMLVSGFVLPEGVRPDASRQCSVRVTHLESGCSAFFLDMCLFKAEHTVLVRYHSLYSADVTSISAVCDSYISPGSVWCIGCM